MQTCPTRSLACCTDRLDRPKGKNSTTATYEASYSLPPRTPETWSTCICQCSKAFSLPTAQLQKRASPVGPVAYGAPLSTGNCKTHKSRACGGFANTKIPWDFGGPETAGEDRVHDRILPDRGMTPKSGFLAEGIFGYLAPFCIRYFPFHLVLPWPTLV